MRFRATEELEMIREAVRAFAAAEVAPGARQRDEEQRFDRALYGQLGQLGLAGIPWPELHGGAGGDYLTFTVAVEELAQRCASTGAALAAHHYGSFAIHQYGSDRQKAAWLKGLASGERLAACVLPERRGEGRPEEQGITVCPEEQGYVLHGGCSYVHHAGEADVYVVVAQTQQPAKSRRKSWMAFAVDRSTPGLSVVPFMDKLGLRGLNTGTLRLEHCQVPAAHRLGREDQGGEIADSTQTLESIGSAAQAIGIAQGAMEAAADYAKERKQFGQPIRNHQAVLFKLAEMAVKIEAARLLAYEAAWRADAGMPYRKQAALAQTFAVRMVDYVTIEAVQVFGGYGYMREFQVERHMRDAKVLTAEAGALENRKDFFQNVFVSGR